MTIYDPLQALPDAVCLLGLRQTVNRRLQNWKFWVTYQDVGDGVKVDFAMPQGNIVDGTLTASIPNVSEPSFSADTVGGWVSFQEPPAAGAQITFHYQCQLWSDDDIDDAINAAVRYFWGRFPVEDTATITTDSSTMEYELPSEAVYVTALQSISDSGVPTDIHTGFETYQSSGKRYVRLYRAPNSGTMRVIFYRAPGKLIYDLDTLVTNAGISERAQDSIVFFAMGWILENVLATRVRTNAFLNAEGSNTIKTWDLLQSASSAYSRAEMLAEANRATPHVSRL